MGFVPILIFGAAGAIGSRIPGWLGWPGWLNLLIGLVGSVAGYFASRQVMRWYWNRGPAENATVGA